MIARVLAVAGSDSGGGAGIQADIKTITMLGGHALTAVTAITAQNTRGVTRVDALPPEAIVDQIDAVWDDLGVDAVKIGMIGAAAAAHAVADRLDGCGRPVVLDPVMVATSGAVLADADTIEAFGRLMRAATVVTPNAPELSALTGLPVEDRAGLLKAAHALADRHDVAVLAKGGHLAGDVLHDLLVQDGHENRWSHPRIVTRHTHGTGCTLSSAVATGLAGGLALDAAVDLARDYVWAAIRAAPGLGGGSGPIGQGMGITHFSRDDAELRS